jgi:alkaline phosphatase D
MKIKNLLAWLVTLLLVNACGTGEKFTAEFSNVDRTWAGPDFWANRLQDWKLENGKLVCLNETNPMRTVHVLTTNLSDRKGTFEASVEINMKELLENNASAGMLLGAGPGQDYRQAALIHHSYGKNGGLYISVSASGMLSFHDFGEANSSLHELDLGVNPYVEKVNLTIMAKIDNYYNGLTAIVRSGSEEIGRLENMDIDFDRLVGSIALVSNPDVEAKKGRFEFDNWEIQGTKVEMHPERNGGPVIGTQHTLHAKTVKLTAQLMPIGDGDYNTAWLEIENNGKWEKAQNREVVKPGFTAHFRMENWDDTKDINYRIGYTLKRPIGEETFYSKGTIRKNPIDKEELVVAAFTGNHNNVRPNPQRWGGLDVGKFPWDWGIWFPHTDMIDNLVQHKPDVLFFSGDQVYEGASPTWADRKNGTLDYLYKWYLWSWAYADLTAEIPTISLPDDHDVYHGNIWGAGGRKAVPSPTGGTAQDGGGYKMPAEWVKMVERTQTSHLPDPFDDKPVEQGIGTYFTDLNYGGVSFAILEDRKFKSAPKVQLPEAGIVNGWARNKDFNVKKDSDVEGAILLGDRQLNFLEYWASDWKEETQMKAVLSQTIFADVVTMPSTEISDANFPSLEIYPKDGYAPDDMPVTDMDSNGWPRTGRDKAVKTIRKAFAVHIAGDQHLGSTVQYGVDEWNDSGFALCVPSIANFYPRRWFPKEEGKNRKPGSPRYTGEHEDGFGNKMTVHAVSNPFISGVFPAELHDRAAGYGVVRFNKNSREITLENWSRYSNPSEGGKPYDGWPITINQEDNYGRKAAGFLPELNVRGIVNPVVQLIDETNNEIVYTLRISGQSFTPKVFNVNHTYTVKVGKESKNTSMQSFEGLKASDSEASIDVTFD